MNNQTMTDNYYEIKTLRLKILYLLAGWAVFFINIEALFALTLTSSGSLFSLKLSDDILSIILLIAYGVSALLLLYILIFSNWIRLRFWETCGLSVIFMIATLLTAVAHSLTILFLPGEDIISVLAVISFNWILLTFGQIVVIFPIISIGYLIWISWLKKRQSYISLSEDAHGWLCILNYVPFFLMLGSVILAARTLD